eukprot:Opistho-2@48941
MDGGQRLEAQVAAGTGAAQLTPQLEALQKVHRRPPARLALGELGAGQHRVVGADPAAQRHLQPHQRQRQRNAPAQAGRYREALHQRLDMAVAHHLHRQQGEQHERAQQVQRDDGGKQLHGHGQGTERALHTHPHQRECRPPGADRWRPARVGTAATAVGVPGAEQCQRQDHAAHTGGEVAVHHLDPGFAVRHRASGHGGLRFGDFLLRAQWAGTAVATWPVGATQAGVGQPGERAKQHQVKGEKQGQQGECAQPLRHAGAALAQPDPQQRTGGQQHPRQQHLQYRGQVDQGLFVHGSGFHRPGTSHEPDARSRRSRSRLALPAPCRSMRDGKRIIQLPMGSTT